MDDSPDLFSSPVISSNSEWDESQSFSQSQPQVLFNALFLTTSRWWCLCNFLILFNSSIIFMQGLWIIFFPFLLLFLFLSVSVFTYYQIYFSLAWLHNPTLLTCFYFSSYKNKHFVWVLTFLQAECSSRYIVNDSALMELFRLAQYAISIFSSKKNWNIFSLLTFLCVCTMHIGKWFWLGRNSRSQNQLSFTVFFQLSNFM
jgi:hypothetical protein